MSDFEAFTERLFDTGAGLLFGVFEDALGISDFETLKDALKTNYEEVADVLDGAHPQGLKLVMDAIRFVELKKKKTKPLPQSQRNQSREVLPPPPPRNDSAPVAVQQPARPNHVNRTEVPSRKSHNAHAAADDSNSGTEWDRLVRLVVHFEGTTDFLQELPRTFPHRRVDTMMALCFYDPHRFESAVRDRYDREVLSRALSQLKEEMDVERKSLLAVDQRQINTKDCGKQHTHTAPKSDAVVVETGPDWNITDDGDPIISSSSQMTEDGRLQSALLTVGASPHLIRLLNEEHALDSLEALGDCFGDFDELFEKEPHADRLALLRVLCAHFHIEGEAKLRDKAIVAWKGEKEARPTDANIRHDVVDDGPHWNITDDGDPIISSSSQMTEDGRLQSALLTVGASPHLIRLLDEEHALDSLEALGDCFGDFDELFEKEPHADRLALLRVLCAHFHIGGEAELRDKAIAAWRAESCQLQRSDSHSRKSNGDEDEDAGHARRIADADDDAEDLFGEADGNDPKESRQQSHPLPAPMCDVTFSSHNRRSMLSADNGPALQRRLSGQQEEPMTSRNSANRRNEGLPNQRQSSVAETAFTTSSNSALSRTMPFQNSGTLTSRGSSMVVDAPLSRLTTDIDSTASALGMSSPCASQASSRCRPNATRNANAQWKYASEEKEAMPSSFLNHYGHAAGKVQLPSSVTLHDRILGAGGSEELVATIGHDLGFDTFEDLRAAYEQNPAEIMDSVTLRDQTVLTRLLTGNTDNNALHDFEEIHGEEIARPAASHRTPVFNASPPFVTTNSVVTAEPAQPARIQAVTGPFVVVDGFESLSIPMGEFGSAIDYESLTDDDDDVAVANRSCHGKKRAGASASPNISSKFAGLKCKESVEEVLMPSRVPSSVRSIVVTSAASFGGEEQRTRRRLVLADVDRPMLLRHVQILAYTHPSLIEQLMEEWKRKSTMGDGPSLSAQCFDVVDGAHDGAASSASFSRMALVAAYALHAKATMGSHTEVCILYNCPSSGSNPATHPAAVCDCGCFDDDATGISKEHICLFCKEEGHGWFNHPSSPHGTASGAPLPVALHNCCPQYVRMVLGERGFCRGGDVDCEEQQQQQQQQGTSSGTSLIDDRILLDMVNTYRCSAVTSGFYYASRLGILGLVEGMHMLLCAEESNTTTSLLNDTAMAMIRDDFPNRVTPDMIKALSRHPESSLQAEVDISITNSIVEPIIKTFCGKSIYIRQLLAKFGNLSRLVLSLCFLRSEIDTAANATTTLNSSNLFASELMSDGFTSNAYCVRFNATRQIELSLAKSMRKHKKANHTHTSSYCCADAHRCCMCDGNNHSFADAIANWDRFSSFIPALAPATVLPSREASSPTLASVVPCKAFNDALLEMQLAIGVDASEQPDYVIRMVETLLGELC